MNAIKRFVLRFFALILIVAALAAVDSYAQDGVWAYRVDSTQTRFVAVNGAMLEAGSLLETGECTRIVTLVEWLGDTAYSPMARHRARTWLFSRLGSDRLAIYFGDVVRVYERRKGWPAECKLNRNLEGA